MLNGAQAIARRGRASESGWTMTSIRSHSRRLPHSRRHGASLAAGVGLALVVGLPLAGRAQPPPAHPAPPASAMGPFVADTGQPANRQYPVTQRPETRPWSPSGWGLSATWRGRSTDLSGRTDWRVDPDARPGEAEAGLSWHGQDASFMAGYAKPNFDPPAAGYPHSPHPQGLFGFNLTLRPR
jgi:hypothetical protein